MDTKSTAIAVVVALVVIGGAVVFLGMGQAPAPLAPAPSEKASMLPYQNEAYDLAFQYPSNLFVHAREAGTATLPQLALLMAEDTQENRDVVEGRVTDGREGPTGITVDVYPNPESRSARDWVAESTNWTVATSAAEPIMVGTREGVTYTWSGLYEGRTVVLTEGDKAYVLSVTWMNPEDQIVRDFDMVLNSLSI